MRVAGADGQLVVAFAREAAEVRRAVGSDGFECEFG